MTLEDMKERSKRRKKKGRKRRDGWEKLRERRLLGIGTLQDGSLTSANGPQGRVVTAFGGGTIPNMMNGNPNPPNVPGGFASKSLEEKSEQYSPRDNDDDVFIDIESARRRSRQLGCIGVSRRISKTGKIVWMPCTNMTDYNNLTGMTALGRHNQDKRTQQVVRTILSGELKKRKKSLVEEIIGKAIGPKISGVSRFSARTITQRFDPNAEDGDGDGLLQDGSAFERPNLPSVPKPSAQEPEKPMSSLSLSSVGRWFDTTTPQQREKLTGTPIENFSASTRSTRGFASASKPIKAEPIKIDGLENPDASETNPFRNLGGRKMGEIIRGLVKPANRNKKQRTTYLIGGTTGGGKSTVLDDHLVVQGIVPGRTEAAHVDPDFIKLGLSGYNDGAGAPMVHDESLRSAQRTMDDARKEGMDVVATGAGSTRQRAIIAQARQNGDKVVAHWVHVPAEEASKRIKAREQLDGRKIPDQTSHFARSIPRMVSDAVSNGEVDEFYIWDNNVEQGKPPRLIASFKNGKLDILDQTKLDEFMNGNKLSPKQREGDSLSDGAREALDESDSFMGFASGKNKKGGRYTPPKGKTTPTSPFGNDPGTGKKTSLKQDPDAISAAKSALSNFNKKVKDYMTRDEQGNPRNIQAFLTDKLKSRIRAVSYKPDAVDGTPISIGKLSLNGKLSTPEAIDAVLDAYVPIKNPNESMEDFAKRIISSMPHMQFSGVSELNPPEKYLAKVFSNIGYNDDLQKSVRDVLRNELINNDSFKSLVEEYGMPFFMGAPNDLSGDSLLDSGTTAFHASGFGLVVIGEKSLKEGKVESIGSTVGNRKFDTVQETLRHEWFHYLDAITLASDQVARDKRLNDYLSGLIELLNPEDRMKKLYPTTSSILEDAEKRLVEALSEGMVKNGMSPEDAVKQAKQVISQKLQEPLSRNKIINDVVPQLLDAVFSPDLIDDLTNDRSGISDTEAKAYSAYARYGIHELIAEIGRMITSTAEERNSLSSNIVKIDSSTIDILVNYMPSISRGMWISVIQSAYPGIQIKSLRGKL